MGSIWCHFGSIQDRFAPKIDENLTKFPRSFEVDSLMLNGLWCFLALQCAKYFLLRALVEDSTALALRLFL
jgi:hypothetical protein